VDAKDAEAFSNVFFSRSLFGIERVAQTRGYNVIIANGGVQAESAVAALVQQKKVDGLILPPSTAKRQLIAKLNGFPVVILGQPDTEQLAVNWVDNNNGQGAELAVEHLLQKNYQRVAYLGGDKRLGFVNRRVNGYLRALEQKH
jgi:DNA-binding LacI/PurR family transcriptional regulator